MSKILSDDAVGIVGGGNSAHALACYLNKSSSQVHMFIRNVDTARELSARKTISSEGYLDGTYSLAGVHNSMSSFCAAVKTIFIATTADAYTAIADAMAPFLREDHLVILFSSKLLGSVLFENRLKKLGCRNCAILETDALFACRLQGTAHVNIRNKKRWNLVSAPCFLKAEENFSKVRRYFEGLELADNVIQRGLTDFGAIAHPTIMLANLNKIDRGEDFLFYVDGLTPRTAALLSAVHSEYAQIASAYGTSLVEIPNLLNSYYGAELGSAYEAMRSVSNYKTSLAPKSLDHRYLKEDISCTLVPARELARKANVPTPSLDAIVHLASCILRVPFEKEGRTLQSLGWEHLTVDEIKSLISRPSPHIESFDGAKVATAS